MHLETERLIIRIFDSEDWKQVYHYVSEPDVMKWMPEGALNEEETKAFIEQNRGAEAEKFAVALKSDLTVIGHMVYHEWFAPSTYEIGWVFNKSYHNKGYATEAALALLKHGFEEQKLHRIISTCQPQNLPSYKVMEKIGMRREGDFKKCIYRETGEWWDEYFYAMLEEDWFRS